MKLSIRMAPDTIELQEYDYDGNDDDEDDETPTRTQIINELIAFGFTRGKVYAQGKWSLISISTLFKDDICVAFYQNNNSYWYEIVALFNDGTRLTLSTDLNAKHYPKLPNQTFLVDDMFANSLAENLDIFLKHLTQLNKIKSPLNEHNFKESYEKVYAENIVNAKKNQRKVS